MISVSTRAARYLAAWLTGRADLVVREIVVAPDGRPVPATLLAPRRGRNLPAWIVLHGLTRPGRAHPELVRFSRALASTGAAVLVPEVPRWRALDLAPGPTVPTVRAALDALPSLPETSDAPAGLVGFSVGAPQAVLAAAAPGVRERVAGVAAFGGYVDLERTVRFLLTGRHEWAGTEHRSRPDPYGRWVFGANFLTDVPGFGDRDDVAGALRQLAREAGDRAVVAWDPSLVPLQDELRSRLGPAARRVYDLFVPPGGREPEPEGADELARALASAGRRVEPGLAPRVAERAPGGPVHVLHGRGDRLIPFSEAYRLGSAIPEGVERRVTVTRLFAHSGQDPFPWREGPREAARFVTALSAVLELV